MSITQKKGFVRIVAVFTLIIGCFVTPGVLPVSAANAEYVLTASDVTYEDLGSGNIRLTGLADTYNDDAQTKPYTMVIPNEIDGYTVTSVSGGSGEWASGADTIIFEETSTVTEIKNFAFKDCPNLKYFVVPEKATVLGCGLFLDNAMTSVTFDEDYSKNTFSMEMFAGGTFEYVKIPEDISSLVYMSMSASGRYTGEITTRDYGEN